MMEVCRSVSVLFDAGEARPLLSSPRAPRGSPLFCTLRPRDLALLHFPWLSGAGLRAGSAAEWLCTLEGN